MMDRLRCFGLLLCAACALLGCGANLSRPAPAPDCGAGDGYDFPHITVDASTLTVAPPDAGVAGTTAPMGYPFADLTPGGQLNAIGWVPAPGLPAGRAVDVDPTLTCGHEKVLDLQSSGHNDYGSTFVIEMSGGYSSPLDATGATGISFWARAASAASDKSITFELSDRYTDSRSMLCMDTSTTNMNMDMTANNVTPPMAGGTSTTLPYTVPGPNDCGNFYQHIIQFNTQWTLYLLPFGSFAQQLLPNRNPNGLDPSALWAVLFQIPKEANFEIWIDQLGVYKPKSADAGP